jgi:hypothetical protein
MDSTLSKVVVLKPKFPDPESFRLSCKPQTFSLPKSFMEYIWLNPKTPNGYLKTIKCCKLLFLKNPILLIDRLHYSCGNWHASVFNYRSTTIDMKAITSKVWLLDKLLIPSNSPINNISLLLSKLYQSDIKILFLFRQTITLNELLRLSSSNVKEYFFGGVTVIYDDGSKVPLDKIVEQLPCIPSVSTFTYYDLNIPFGNMKTLVDSCSKWDKFILDGINEFFDTESFYEHLKKSECRIDMRLGFGVISEGYESRIERIVDDILQTDSFSYFPPIFSYANMGLKYHDLLKVRDAVMSKYRKENERK